VPAAPADRPAGSGKSTWAAEHLADTIVVSTDRMREELTGDPADQSQNYLVFQRCMDRVRTSCTAGGGDLRCDKLHPGLAPDARAGGSLVRRGDRQLPLRHRPGEALLRNASRERCVPEDVVARQHRLLEPPALYEADRHCLVRADGGLELYWPAGIA